MITWQAIRRRGRAKCFLLASLCLLIWCGSLQASVTTLQLSDRPINPVPFSEYFTDPEGELTWQQVQQLDPSRWQTGQGLSQYHFGFDPATHWIRFRLVSGESLVVPEALLSIDYPLLRQLDLLLLRDGELVEHSLAGIEQATTHNRVIHFPNPAFRIPLEADSALDVLIRVQSTGSTQLPMQLWPVGQYANTALDKTLLYGGFFGLMFMLGLYSLFSSVAMRSPAQLVFAAYVLSSSLLMVELIGLRQFVDGTGASWLQEHLLPLLLLLTLLMSVLLTERLIELRQHHRYILRACRISLVLVVLALMAVPFLEYQPAIALASLLLGPLSLMMIIGGIRLAWRGNRLAALYAVARTAMLSGALISAFAYYNLLQLSISSHLPYLLGVLLEGVLLALTIAIQIARQRREKDAARQETLEQARRMRLVQDKLVQLKDEAKADLEHKVQERTFELEVALRELAEANRILEERNTTDTLTGVKNRQHFDKRYVAELRRSRREQTPFSLIMMDVDHFKNVNDSHGHMIGDECLRAVAQMAQAQLKRPADTITRFGGEEFAVLLPNTPHEGALRVAEAIREVVEKFELKVQDLKLRVTVSLGVATMQLHSDSYQQMLLEQADKALYRAKQQGRNQVVGIALQPEQQLCD